MGILGPPSRSEVTILTELSEYNIEICVLLNTGFTSGILLRYSISIFSAHNASECTCLMITECVTKGDREEWEGADRGNGRTDRMVEDSNMLCIG